MLIKILVTLHLDLLSLISEYLGHGNTMVLLKTFIKALKIIDNPLKVYCVYL